MPSPPIRVKSPTLGVPPLTFNDVVTPADILYQFPLDAKKVVAFCTDGPGTKPFAFKVNTL